MSHIKFIIIFFAIFITSSCLQKAEKSATSGKISADGCISNNIRIEQLQLVFESLIREDIIEQTSNLSPRQISNLQPDLDSESIAYMVQDIQKLADEPSEKTRLLDELKAQLHGLSDADELTLTAVFNEMESVQKSFSRQDEILAKTGKYVFWNASGIKFPTLYQIVDEKILSFDLVQAMKEFFRDDFSLQYFITNQPQLSLFRSWIYDRIYEPNLRIELKHAISKIQGKRMNQSAYKLPDEDFRFYKEELQKYISGQFEENNEEIAEITLELFNYYISKKSFFQSVGEITTYADQLMAATRKTWINTTYEVSEHVEDSIEALVPYLYHIRTTVNNPKITTKIDYEQALIEEKKLVWTILQHDLLTHPTDLLKQIVQEDQLAKIKIVAEGARSNSFGGFIKQRNVVIEMHERVDKMKNERLKEYLQRFIHFAKISTSAGLITAPIWIPIAVILSIIPTEREPI